MEPMSMVYDNPSVHSGQLRDRLHERAPAGPSATPMLEHQAALDGMPSAATDPLSQLLGTMRMGAILVSREGRVLYSNDAGKEAFAAPSGLAHSGPAHSGSAHSGVSHSAFAHSGLALRGDHIVATAPDTRRRFSLALHHACGAPYVDGALLLDGTDGSGFRKALRIVSMERIGRFAGGRTHRGEEGLALLCIGCSRSRAPQAAMLAQVFGLTGAESALMAAVAGGERLQACAARRGVSLATVRAQLRNVFVKTGAATQAELTFIAWSIPGLWID